MEILGIVWAASIVNPSVVAASAMDVAGRSKLQHLTSIEETASWFDSLAQAYGWSLPSFVEAASSRYVSSTSWLVPNLSEIDFAQESSAELQNSQFTALVPAIGTTLTNFDNLLTDSASSTPATESWVAHEWQSWNAVASVRLEQEDHPPVTEQVAYLDDACLQNVSAAYQASPIAMTAAPKTQLWVHNHFIGDVSGQVAASKIATKLRTLIQEGKLDPAKILPIIGSNFVGVSHHSDILFIVDETMRSHPEVPATAIAVQWINNLRRAFGEEPLGLAAIQMAAEGLETTSQKLYGTASWYGPGFHGRQTANGEIFDENALTAAHKSLPFNTHLKVTNRLNGRSVVVRINDRGPYIGQRSLDLSKAASRCLGSTDTGVIPYEAVILELAPKPELDELTTAQLSAE